MRFQFVTKSLRYLYTFVVTLFARDEDTLIHKIPLHTWQRMAWRRTYNNTLYILDYAQHDVAQAIGRIKNKHDTKILDIFTTLISDILLEELSELQTFQGFAHPVITHIPSHRDSLARRGYNPSALIAESVSKKTAIPYKSNYLTLKHTTKSQKTLSRSDRQKNIAHSMSVPEDLRHKVNGSCIIVIDDVVTTGATLAEARRALTKAGARKIVTIAIAH